VNSTVELLRVLGSPFGTSSISMNRKKAKEFFQVSAKNRMLFLYLDMMKQNKLSEYSGLFEKENLRMLKIDDAVASVSRVLTDAQVEHAIFKTIRPYRSTTVDIDTLIFEDEAYPKSVRTMEKAGYKLVVQGPRSTTLWDQEANMGVDLYEQVAVSFITYMNKQTLIDYSTTTKLRRGERIRILAPEADLACIIAHSMIKEQMYTLSEYYSYVYYLRQMRVDNFLEIARQNHIISAARAHTAITALLHHTAHKTVPKKLRQILCNLGKESYETTRLIERNYETPHKYHPITIARSLLEIARGKETRNSLADQLTHMFDPNISKDFLRKLTEHVFRETY
jgi:hypothetical protein